MRSSASGEVESRFILGMRVDGTSYAHASDLIVRLAHDKDWRYVCVANVHMTMEAFDDPSFRDVVNGAGLVTPDGVPLVWGLEWLGVPDAERVYGPSLTPAVCEAAQAANIAVGFYGGTTEAVESMSAALLSEFPRLNIAYRYSPPFRPLTAEEDASVVDAIAKSGARILFVGLGCPKQERWMAEHQGRVPAVMLGVGAAFDFISGEKVQAPSWLQERGLEWLFRFLTEPRRLWKRYLYLNPRFVYHFGRQLVRSR